MSLAAGTDARGRRRCLGALAATACAGVPGLLAAQGTPGATAPARRMVVLGGALTETVYALGAEGLLVGTDTTSVYPEAALRTAKVGYMRQLSAEGLLSLRPDAVLGTTEAGPSVVLDQVRGAGVRVALVPADHTWGEVRRKCELVGQFSGREAQARALWGRLDAEWRAVQQQVAAAARRPRVLFVLAHTGSPMVAGTGTAAHALIGLAGGVNVVQSFAGYKPLTAEALAQAAPQVILSTDQGVEALGGAAAFWARAEWALTPAFARRSLVSMDANHLLGFGPRLPGAVRSLHAQLQALSA